jgi:predicted nucleotidyltransferase
LCERTFVAGRDLRRIVERLQRVEGIEAIALGGSQARDAARPDSDVDIGLYYDPEAPFSVEELDAAARDLDDRHIPKLVTRFGDWGAGVNGGGWLVIDGRGRTSSIAASGTCAK